MKKQRPLSYYLDLMKSAQDKQEWVKEKRYGETALKKLPRLSYSPFEEYTLYCRLANAYGHMAEYSRSLDICYKAELIASKNHFAPAYSTSVAYMIGCDFLFMRNLGQALPQFQKVKEHYEKYHDESSAINKQIYFHSLIGLGYCYLYKNDLSKAGEIIETNIPGLLPSIANASLLLNYHHLNGEYLMALKKYNQAREAFQKSAEISNANNLSSSINEVKIHLAVIELLEGNIESAIRMLELLLKDTKKLKLNRLYCESGLLLSKCYLINKMPDKAFTVEMKIKPILKKLDITWLYEKTRETEGLFRNLHQSKAGAIPKILAKSLAEHNKKTDPNYAIIGNSAPMLEISALIEKIAPTDLPVLIQGDTGTGKELIARAIHGNSERGNEQLLTLNCGAIPETLLENELFGHTKGAFTDARDEKKGYIELASEGTLFLDEISEMSANMQQKLLRVLEEKQVWALGAEKPMPINTRFIFASNQDIEEMAKAKLFRKELFYRINTIVINLPPLRERKDDIPLLINHFFAKYSSIKTPDAQRITPDALALLQRYPWPGNVRELENEIKKICALYPNKVIQEEMLSESIKNNIPTPATLKKDADAGIKTLTDNFQKDIIEEALLKHKGNIMKIARILGCTRPYLYRRIKQLKIPIK